jgi:hypothetical protein
VGMGGGAGHKQPMGTPPTRATQCSVQGILRTCSSARGYRTPAAPGPADAECCRQQARHSVTSALAAADSTFPLCNLSDSALQRSWEHTWPAMGPWGGGGGSGGQHRRRGRSA